MNTDERSRVTAVNVDSDPALVFVILMWLELVLLIERTVNGNRGLVRDVAVIVTTDS